MAKATDVTFDNVPKTVVSGAEFEIQVTFNQAIDAATFTENDVQFSGGGGGGEVLSIEADPVNSTTVFKIGVKLDITVEHKIGIILSGVTDSNNIAGEDKIVESSSIKVIASPHFTIIASSVGEFDLTGFFSNPLTGSITVTKLTTPALPTNVDVQNNVLTVTSTGITQTVYDTARIGKNEFVDYIIGIQGANTAGNAQGYIILRVTSAKPTTTL